MAFRYVDNTASGANNGTSWANAWTSLTSITGISAGDTVYISGGPTGGTQTYNLTGAFDRLPGFASGTLGNRVTYQIGQDSAHNGTVIFNQTGGGSAAGWFIKGGSNFNMLGDAGDGLNHFQVTGTVTVFHEMTAGEPHFRIAYFDLGTMQRLGVWNPVTDGELDHITIKIGGDAAADSGMLVAVNGSNYRDSSIHHITMQVPYNPNNSYFGPDGFNSASPMVGLWFHDNVITSYVDLTLTTTQHMDGFQLLLGSYLEFNNNNVTGMSNYGLYFESTVSTFNHVKIYDNIVSAGNSTFGTGSSGGIVISQKIAGTMNDIVVGNNTIVDFQDPGSQGLTILANSFGPYTNTTIANNVLVSDSAALAPRIDAGVPSPTNTAQVSTTNAASYFVSYTKYAASNLRPTSGATPLIGQGVDLSAYFATDADGIAWAGGSGWGIGAYKYISGMITQSIKRLGRFLRLHGPSN